MKSRNEVKHLARTRIGQKPTEAEPPDTSRERIEEIFEYFDGAACAECGSVCDSVLAEFAEIASSLTDKEIEDAARQATGRLGAELVCGVLEQCELLCGVVLINANVAGIIEARMVLAALQDELHARHAGTENGEASRPD